MKKPSSRYGLDGCRRKIVSHARGHGLVACADDELAGVLALQPAGHPLDEYAHQSISRGVGAVRWPQGLAHPLAVGFGEIQRLGVGHARECVQCGAGVNFLHSAQKRIPEAPHESVHVGRVHGCVGDCLARKPDFDVLARFVFSHFAPPLTRPLLRRATLVVPVSFVGRTRAPTPCLGTRCRCMTAKSPGVSFPPALC